jgi:hypothetical protein
VTARFREHACPAATMITPKMIALPAIIRHGTAPLPAALVCRSFAQYATTMFFAHFVGDACSGEPHQLGERCVRPTRFARQCGNETAYRRVGMTVQAAKVNRTCHSQAGQRTHKNQ